MRDLTSVNVFLSHSQPSDIVRWGLKSAERPVLFTNFRPSSISLIHLVTNLAPKIPVVWIDSGFNTEETYRYIQAVAGDMDLNLITYSPKMTSRHWQSLHGDIPLIGSPLHDEFTELVKLEPFKRAMSDLNPDVWFTGIRKDQTDYRSNLEVLSPGPNDSLKMAPFINLTETDVDQYILNNKLPVYLDYFDPTKGPEHRECGLQLLA